MMALCSCLTAALAPGRKRVLKVPRACFANRGVDPGDIDVPFGITADAPFAAASTNIRVVAGAAAEAEAFDCGAVAH
ncbi:putative glycoside hydrolase [Flavobacterium sp. MXW15]|uniref:Glycoside hydrolase n=1 Tax=Xanthomonas chitinilytica TaxID=2989819 RepID=A0ABT3K0P1_9XANT|nr:putative glycoside hydrolase [Xanthomonas sp. H13-6]MCW4456601.1 putative glycoside hydrolase [Flavobacterium sp. MXW15]MCW4474303.1 putative glycoside hydrolase [Xanthomonas sp. H13-6]